MKLRRKLYSENNNPGFISKISKGIKNTARSVADKTKQGYNFVKTHTAKETASEVSKGVKKGSKAAWKYVKEPRRSYSTYRFLCNSWSYCYKIIKVRKN